MASKEQTAVVGITPDKTIIVLILGKQGAVQSTQMSCEGSQLFTRPR